jgi:hypothetical protein
MWQDMTAAIASLLVWLLADQIFALLSGWRFLARHYRSVSVDRAGRYWRFKTGRVGLVRYGLSLTFGASERGVSVTPLPVLRMAHAPLFIPWSDLVVVTRREAFIARTILKTRLAPRVKIEMSTRLWKQLESEKHRPTTGLARGPKVAEYS